MKPRRLKLTRLLQDEDPRVRLVAVSVLAGMGEMGREFSPELAALLGDTDGNVLGVPTPTWGRGPCILNIWNFRVTLISSQALTSTVRSHDVTSI